MFIVLDKLLVQMLIAFAGFFSGYNGSFEFKEPGVSYEDYPYYGMRLVKNTKYIWLVLLSPTVLLECFLSATYCVHWEGHTVSLHYWYLGGENV